LTKPNRAAADILHGIDAVLIEPFSDDAERNVGLALIVEGAVTRSIRCNLPSCGWKPCMAAALAAAHTVI
jgi:hypothetical protein